MNEKNQQAAQIARLQDNLSSIRKIAGWTAEQLGEKMGVTKQTVSNLENKKTPMTLVQYIAIRAILDYETETNKDNTVLPKVIDILLDSEGEYSRESYEQIMKKVDTVASAATGGVSGEVLFDVATLLLSTWFIGFDGITKTSSWLSKIMKGNNKRKW